MKETGIRTTFRLDPNLFEILKRESLKRRRTMTGIVEQSLADFMSRRGWLSKREAANFIERF